MQHVLATAIGALASRVPGLSRIILPSTLPGRFRVEVASACSEALGYDAAVVVGDNQAANEISPGEAIAYRTPEGTAQSTILLVSTTRHYRELKSLEAFRDLLANGLPGGLPGGQDAVIDIGAACGAAAALICKIEGVQADQAALGAALERASTYLSRAYEAFGNSGAGWTDAYWRHLDRLCNGVAGALKTMSPGLPGRETFAVHLAAGLPRPKAHDGFEEPAHGPLKYANIIRDRWSGQDEIRNALEDIAAIDSGDPSASHPLGQLEWETVTTTQVALRHPVLAIAFHSSGEPTAGAWLGAWAGTSEAAFFSERNDQEAAWDLHAKGDSGGWTMLGRLPWQGVDCVLPVPANKLDEERKIHLGVYKLAIATGGGADCKLSFKVECSPKTSATADVLAARRTSAGIEVEFSLARRIPPKGGKWREKPVVLSLKADDTQSRAALRDPPSIRCIVPHPVRETIFIGEQKAGKGKVRAKVHADTMVEVAESGDHLLQAAAGTPDISLDDRRSTYLVAVASRDGAGATWEGGEALEQSQDAIVAQAALYIGKLVPESAGITAGNHAVSVDYPEVATGRWGPIVAAIAGEALIPVMPHDQAKLDRDPRATLEEWYARETVRSAPSAELKESLAICVLSSGGGDASLAWNEQRRLHTDIKGNFDVKSPQPPSDGSIDQFWQAYDSLGLSKLFNGSGDTGHWPSAMDLKSLKASQVTAYVEAYERLLAHAAADSDSALFAYPFSCVVYDAQRGAVDGILLSPLHPLRLAWNWSVQVAGARLGEDPKYGTAPTGFLRFIDGENFPFVGPAPDAAGQMLSLGIASKDQCFFAAWSFVAKVALHAQSGQSALELLGKRLPLRAPSGLDSGGVSSALRDYLRVFPSAPQLRIALSTSSQRERSTEIDDAVVEAASNLLVVASDRLPGGIRVSDSPLRLGAAPDANTVLRSLSTNRDSNAQVRQRAFEWVTAATDAFVDVRFVEDSLVTVEAWQTVKHDDRAGCVGPTLPVNRFTLWDREQTAKFKSAIPTKVAAGSFSNLDPFARAVSTLEAIAVNGPGAMRVGGKLQLGQNLMNQDSRWTVTGNRYIDPAILAHQLHKRADGLTLWEWRPAFLARSEKETESTISSSHPYTVLARPSPTLRAEISATLSASVDGLQDDAPDKLLAELGMRGIGLSSLLAMGQTHHVGAIGFYLGFEALKLWESSGGADELRCIVPIDALYPLLELLAPGAPESNSRRRADLLLLQARISGPSVHLQLHPVEVKNRTSKPASFPSRDDKTLIGYEEQLVTTTSMLRRMVECYEGGGRDLVLVNAAMATFVEAALSLRPHAGTGDAEIDLALLRAAAAGQLEMCASPGVLLWFQSGGAATNGADYELRNGLNGGPGTILANPKAILGPSASQFAGVLATLLTESACDPVAKDKALLPGTVGAAPAGPDTAGVQAPQPKGIVPVELPVSNPVVAVPTPVVASAKASPVAPPTAPSPPSGTTPGKDAGAIPAGAAQSSDGIEILIGYTQDGVNQHPVVFRPSDTALGQMNMGVVGDVGAGKTQFVKSVLYQLVNSAAGNRGVAPKIFIFDYKKDYARDSFPQVIDAIVLDPGNTPMPLNFFALAKGAGKLEKVRRANFFRDILRRISNIGEVQSNRVYDCIMAAYAECPPGYWPNLEVVFDRYKAMVGAKPDSVVSILRTLVDLQVFDPDPKKVMRFEDLFKQGIILNLAGLSGAGEKVEHIVATMFLDFLYTDYMKNVPKADFLTAADGTGRRFVDTYVVIDEAHHAMGGGFDVLMKILLEGREFGMGVILSSQYLSHFNDGGENWAQPLSTWMVHNVRGTSAKDFDRLGFHGDTSQMAHTVSKLAPHWGYFRCAHGFNQGLLVEGRPFFALKKPKGQGGPETGEG